MPYLYRCGAVKSFPKNGKCPNARRGKKDRHYYCQKKQIMKISAINVQNIIDPDPEPIFKEYYLPCLFQKTYRRNHNEAHTITS
jgi:hypothetical protein